MKKLKKINLWFVGVLISTFVACQPTGSGDANDSTTNTPPLEEETETTVPPATSDTVATSQDTVMSDTVM